MLPLTMQTEKKGASNRVFISLLIGVTVIVIVLVLQASTSGISTVLLPSDLSAMSGDTRTRLRVAGRVAPASIAYRVEPNFLLEFSIHDPAEDQQSEQVDVVYNGIKPDMFAVGRDVILDGEWAGDVFIASKLMTQCPSKYEPPVPQGAPESYNQG